MVAFALIVPFTGTALAQHVTAIDVTPNTDTAPAQTCNAFTVTLTGPQAAGDTNPGVPGETIDVIVTDTDTDQAATTANEAQSDITFCTPPAGTDPAGAENGPNPVAPSANQTQPAGGFGTTGPGQGGQSTRRSEFCCTDANGQLTFGISSTVAGNFSVTAFFDDEDDDNPAGDLAETVTKTFTAPAAQGNQGVATVDCEPETDTNPEGTTHTFNCTARDVNNNPVSGATIQFDVVSGPNAEEVGPRDCQASTTDAQGNTTTNIPPSNQTTANGQATCSYTDTEQADNVTTADASPPGTDTIIGFVNQTPGAGQTGTPGADTFEPQDQITKTFVGDANSINCTPDNGTANSGDIVTITCLVTDEAGQPVPGVLVSFTESGAGTFRTGGSPQTDVTDAAGQATVEVITGQTEEGTISVTGTIQDRADDPNTTPLNESTQPGADTNCGANGVADPGTNADCSDTATVVVTQRDDTPPPPPEPACSDGIDNDGDGRIDFPADEDCTDELDNAERDIGGRFNTTITIRYNRKARPPAFVGALASERDECTEGRRVVLKKKRPGKDRVVGRDSSNRRGNWKIVKRRARGRYFAVVRARTSSVGSGATVVCNRDVSVTITIRRRR
jgi:protocatechuate 3,4-dioxygenase beta subunit